MLGALRKKLGESRFFREREPRRGPVRLTARNIYILPTRTGVAAAFVIFALVIGAINFQSSLGLAYAFIIAGMALVSMVDAQRNLMGITVTPLDAEPVFAGDRARFALHLENPGKRARFSVTLKARDSGEEEVQVLDLPGGITAAEVELEAPARGVLTLGHFTVASRYPLNFFGSWSPVNSSAEVLVYPRPGHKRPWPDSGGLRQGDEERYGHKRGGRDGEFAGLRDYLPGDRVSAIDWKAAARTNTLPVREYHMPADQALELDYSALTNEPEARLEQLCRWVLDADRLGLDYSLTLPSVEIARSKGPAHKRRCLEALARFEP